MNTQIKLRPYQLTAVERIRAAFRQGKRRVLLVIPTGGGKTITFTDITAKTAANKRKVLTLAHRKELIKQASKTFDNFGIEHGVIHPRYTVNLTKGVQVASVQTLVRRLERYKVYAPDLIIIDEAHHAAAGSWRKILEFYPSAFCLGVTATPCRLDGRGLGDVFDELIHVIDVPDLIELGFLVKPVVYCPAQVATDSLKKTSSGDYNQKATAALMESAASLVGDVVATYKKLLDGAPTVAFCSSIKHAETIAQAFQNAGYTAAVVSSLNSEQERDERLDGLGAGRYNVICSVDVISEGTDIPAIAGVLLLRPTASLGLYLQQVGRALRPCAGKDHAVVVDHVGNVGRVVNGNFKLKHGFPDEYRTWTLETTKKKNKKTADDEEKTEPVRVCPSCFVTFDPVPICPECGHKYPIKERKVKTGSGEMINAERLKVDRIKKLNEIKRQRAADIAACETLEDYKRVAAKYNYKKGWALHQYHVQQRKKII